MTTALYHHGIDTEAIFHFPFTARRCINIEFETIYYSLIKLRACSAMTNQHQKALELNWFLRFVLILLIFIPGMYINRAVLHDSFLRIVEHSICSQKSVCTVSTHLLNSGTNSGTVKPRAFSHRRVREWEIVCAKGASENKSLLCALKFDVGFN